jgi:hypothetical protein
MIDDAELRRMSPQERVTLARALVALDCPAVMVPDPAGQLRRRLFIAGTIVCSVVLAAWIGVLAVSLPPHFRAGGWRGAWVGFDIVLLAVFLATAWAAWRRRQVLIGCLVVLATLLCCDAWFDTALDWGTRGFLISLLSAVLVELPLAVLALTAARRLLRLTLRRMERLDGVTGAVPGLWQMPLFGDAGTGYRHLLPPAAQRATGLMERAAGLMERPPAQPSSAASASARRG